MELVDLNDFQQNQRLYGELQEEKWGLHIMENMKYQECSDAICRLAPGIGGCMNGIRAMIKEIPTLSEVQKQFFTLIIEYRYEEVLLPVYQKIIQKEFEDCEQKKGMCR